MSQLIYQPIHLFAFPGLIDALTSRSFAYSNCVAHQTLCLWRRSAHVNSLLRVVLFFDGSHDTKQYPAEYLGHRRVKEKPRQRVNPL